jgi:hypothetical protein
MSRLAILFSAAVLISRELAAQQNLPTPVIRDSAGIRIVEYPTLTPLPAPNAARLANPLQFQLNQVAPAFRLEAKPYMVLGGLRDNDAEEFEERTPIINVVQLSNGTIVVNDFAHLKYYSTDGKFLRVAGRRGRGPGEFIQVGELCVVRGDTVLVTDLINRRLSTWDAQGANINTFAPQAPVVPSSCTPDGLVIAADAKAGGSQDTGGEDRYVQHHLVRPNGDVVRSLGMLPADAHDSRLFRHASIILRDSTILVGTGRTYEFRFQKLDGTVIRIVRFGRHGARISDDEWRDRSAQSIPNNVSADERKSRMEILMARKPKGVEPSFSFIRVDPVGRVWVQDYNSNGGFTIFDSTGKLLGRFTLPGYGLVPRTQLAGVGRDFIAIADADSDGALQIRFYRYSMAR